MTCLVVRVEYWNLITVFGLIGGFSVCFMKLGAPVFGTYVYNSNILLTDYSFIDYEAPFKTSPD